MKDIATNPICLINPSLQLIASGRVVASGYIPTCTIVGCPCTDHDSGYRFVEMVFPKGWTSKDLYIKPKTATRNHRSYLRTEYEAMRRAIGLPDNAPEWAFTPETRRLEGNFCFGEGVDVFITESGLMVAMLMVGCNDNGASFGYWKEKSVFATSNGRDNKTKQFTDERSQDDKDEFFERRRIDGFLYDEAVRMYEIPKKDQFPWQLSILIGVSDRIRTSSVGVLCQLITAESRQDQSVVLDQIGIVESIGGGLPHPQVRDLAEKMLWIFHGVNFCDVEDKSEMPEGPPPSDEASVAPAKPTSKITSVRDRLTRQVPKLSDAATSKITPTGVGKSKATGWSPSDGVVHCLSAVGPLLAAVMSNGQHSK